VVETGKENRARQNQRRIAFVSFEDISAAVDSRRHWL
jgi:hypothetical protein